MLQSFRLWLSRLLLPAGYEAVWKTRQDENVRREIIEFLNSWENEYQAERRERREALISSIKTPYRISAVEQPGDQGEFAFYTPKPYEESNETYQD